MVVGAEVDIMKAAIMTITAIEMVTIVRGTMMRIMRNTTEVVSIMAAAVDIIINI